MTKNFIEFGFEFLKLPKGWENSQARLVYAVGGVDIEKQTETFVQTDSAYEVFKDQAEEFEPLFYDFKPGLYIFLLFNLNGVLVPSFRKDNNENRMKYLRRVGQLFTFTKTPAQLKR